MTTCAFSMVSLIESGGFVKLIESVKILEIEACATSFLGLWGVVVVVRWGCSVTKGVRLRIFDLEYQLL